MKNVFFTALALFAGLCAPALAQKYGVTFEHIDWEVVCDNKALGELKLLEDERWQLSDAQTQKLIAAVTGSGRVEFTGGEKPFVLSGSGANAVFLKMDASQGRLDSPGALIKKGSRPESGVFLSLAHR